MAMSASRSLSGAQTPPVDLWRYTAMIMCQAVLPALLLLRDKGRIELNVETSYDHMKLEFIVGLLDEISYPEIPDDIRKAISGYLVTLPGYKNELGVKQSRATEESHRILIMAASHA